MSSASINLKLSDLTIARATREQTLEAAKRSYLEWGLPKGLNLEQYQRLATDTWMTSEACQDDRLITWVLTKRDEPTSLNFLCSCETFRRPAVVTYPASQANGTNRVDRVITYAIASVFTPPETRRKGYASHMLRLLHWVVARPAPIADFPRALWGEPPNVSANMGDACFSVLYSDVGREFYARLGPLPPPATGIDTSEDTSATLSGWRVKQALSTVWDVEQSLAALRNRGSTHPPTWTPIVQSDLKEVWTLDAKFIESEMASVPSDKVRAAFSPAEGVASFMMERYKAQWSKIHPPPTHWGIYKAASEPTTQISNQNKFDLSAFATWALIPEKNTAKLTLMITRLRCPPEHFEDLLRKIMEYARDLELRKVEMWNLPGKLRGLAHESGGRTYEREDKLPSVKWYGRGDIEWVLNEE